MPSLSYGSGAYKRDTGSLPPLECINLFVESAKTSENRVCLQSRPGLATDSTVGTGPIRALYSERGVFSGDLFAVSSATIYRGASSLGTLAGSGPISVAGTASEVLFAAGSTMRRYNGTALSNVSFPDSAAVRAVCVINFHFVAVRGDGTYPGRFYWSDVNDGTTWDSLNYATAERVPDDLLDIAPLGDNIWLFGQSSLEVWQNTGNADLPFERIEQVAFDRGIIDTGCWAKVDNTLVFIGSDAVVYRASSDNPVRISDHWLEEKIAASSSWSMFAFKYQGHEFACARLDDATYAYDTATQQWCEFQTAGANWIAQCAAMAGTDAYFGNDTDGKIMVFSGWADLTGELTREFTAAVTLDSRLSVNVLRLWVNVGQSAVLSGQGSDPKVEMSMSRDAGQTWSDWDDSALGNASIGGAGDYRTVPEWRRLGMFDFPGAMFRFRVTDPVPFRVSAVKLNDPSGGRSR
jgi:hypothetical protein